MSSGVTSRRSGRLPYAVTGTQLILEERLRQLYEEGWDLAHDDEHIMGELVGAARSYLFAVSRPDLVDKDCPSSSWPVTWDEKWWKPSKDPKRNLVKAGALIAAEIDRLLRKEENDRTIGN